jgi:hypothetical protein
MTPFLWNTKHKFTYTLEFVAPFKYLVFYM